MRPIDIADQRLSNQRLAAAPFDQPEQAVQWLGAVQAQDYTGAKWALGLRSQCSDAAIDQAFAEGRIVRTHAMRPTWHFVAPADLRWLLALTSPRVHAVNAYYYRKLELDEPSFVRIHTLFAEALHGGRQCTREELRNILRQAGIATDEPLRMSYILMHAELEGLICSGPKRGKQFTYALLDERVPPASSLTREEALAELTRRYFASHGPATLKDFCWWSGVAAADAKSGVAMAKAELEQALVEGQTYWLAAPMPATEHAPLASEAEPIAYLLPNYDEYVIGYTNHSAVFNTEFRAKLDVLFPHSIVIGGQIVGAWRRVFEKGALVITLRLFTSLGEAEQAAVARAAERYGTFVGLPVILE